MRVRQTVTFRDLGTGQLGSPTLPSTFQAELSWTRCQRRHAAQPRPPRDELWPLVRPGRPPGPTPTPLGLRCRVLFPDFAPGTWLDQQRIGHWTLVRFLHADQVQSTLLLPSCPALGWGTLLGCAAALPTVTVEECLPPNRALQSNPRASEPVLLWT